MYHVKVIQVPKRYGIVHIFTIHAEIEQAMLFHTSTKDYLDSNHLKIIEILNISESQETLKDMSSGKLAQLC